MTTETQAAEGAENQDGNQNQGQDLKFPSIVTAESMKAVQTDDKGEGEDGKGEDEGDNKGEASKTKGRPAGLPPDEEWDHVEFTEEQQKRFNRVYGEMKRQEKLITQMAEDNKRLVELAEQREEREQKAASDTSMADLRQQEREALESGDTDRAIQIREQITEATIEAKLADKGPPAKKPGEGDEGQDGGDGGKPVVSESYLNEERKERLIEWSNEMDGEGRLLRPWCDPKHPDHKKALAAAQTFLNDEDTVQKINSGEMEFDEVLTSIEEINGRLTKPKKRDAAGVLSGNSDARPGKSGGSVKLSEEQKAVAKKMGLSEERYAKSLSLHGVKS